MAARQGTGIAVAADHDRTSLYGRAAELAEAMSNLAAVRRGEPAVIAVTGEPGIGKTALVAAIVEQGERLGLRAVTCSAHEDDRIAPLASLGPALRFGPSPLLDSTEFMELARLHTQPLWLAEQLATYLEQRTETGPLLVAVDDIQWCDPLTSFVLRVLPRRLRTAPIVWVIASRVIAGGGPAAQIINAAERDLITTSIELGGLADDALLAIARDRLGRVPDLTVVRQLAETRGSPFLTVQIVEGIAHSATTDGTVRPHNASPLQQTVQQRLSSTSLSCQRLVRTAAVLGLRFELTDVAELLAEYSAAQLSDALAEAIQSGLLQDDGTAVTFRHALLRDAIYDDLPPSGRVAVHRTFADHLLRTGRGYAAAAPHVLATAAPGDAAAADVLRRAAHEISATMATTSATLIRQAFDLTDVRDPAWGEIGIEAITILSSARQFDDATRFADDLLADDIPPALDARIRLRLLPRLWALGHEDEITRRALTPSDDAVLDERLAAYRALASRNEVPTSTDPVATVLALVGDAEAAERNERRVAARDLFTRARSAAQNASGDGALELSEVAARELAALARTDHIGAALRKLDDSAMFADSWATPRLGVLRARLKLGAGLIDEAAEVATEALELADDLHDTHLKPALHCLLAVTAGIRADPVGARTLLKHSEKHSTRQPLVRALLADADGDPRGPGAIVAAVHHARPMWPEEWLTVAACSAFHQSDAPALAASTNALERLADDNPDVPAIVGAHLLVLALSSGEFDRARAALADSSHGLLATRVEEEFGRFALRSGGRSTAIAVLDAAHDRYTQLGALAYATRVQRVLQAAGARRRRWAAVPKRPATGWEALTEMERTVARLVAEGHSNRSAAEQLVLSPSTISTHLRAVFTKLNVHSRVQLANQVLGMNDTRES